jgi:indolepyruvate ferredoxin oxidoreductase
VQRELREIAGCTVLIYEQTCAAEKRRRRKRGEFPDPPKRMFINQDVCEGCGDCSTQSGCVSIEPLETELGRKRRINQSSCNKDYSCVKGFCPSFVTVLDAEPRKRSGVAVPSSVFEDLSRPRTAPSDEGYSIMVSGIGGTGVVTVGALLGMAAHIDGNHCSIFDMTGLSQKNGAVFSHVRIAKHPERLGSQKIGLGEADLALAFDAVAALAREAAVSLSPERTKIVVNSRVTPTAAFQRDPDLRLDERSMLDKLAAAAGPGGLDAVDATGLGLALLGDSIAANMFLLGFAAQRGSLPVSVEALTAAIEINAVAVQFNKNAFALGRLYAERPTEVTALLPSGTAPTRFTPLTTVGEVVAHRVAHLTAYQDARYAERYSSLVRHVSLRDADHPSRGEALTLAVARNFAKLMAYKDEYEVARLMTDAAFKAELRATFEDGAKIRYNLAPPILSRRDAKTGRPAKREFGAWIEPVFRVLARMRSLRGTAFDPFGYTAERRMERDLIAEYAAMIRDVCSALTPDTYDLAVQLAELPQQIRGYGPVKEASVAQVRARWHHLHRSSG